MSSNPNNNVKGRVKSIRHRLAGQRVRMKIGMHFGHCLFMAFIMILVWLAAREYMADVTVPFAQRVRHLDSSMIPVRNIRNLGDLQLALKGLKYTVVSQDGKLILSEMIYAPSLIIFTFCSGLFILESFGALLSYSREKRRVKKLLAPLDKLTSRVEEI